MYNDNCYFVASSAVIDDADDDDYSVYWERLCKSFRLILQLQLFFNLSIYRKTEILLFLFCYLLEKWKDDSYENLISGLMRDLSFELLNKYQSSLFLFVAKRIDEIYTNQILINQTHKRQIQYLRNVLLIYC